jgi:hypothetical protein
LSATPQLGGDAAPPPHAQPAPTLAEYEAEQRQLASQKAKNLLAYGKVYAYGAMVAAGVQVLIADAAFYWYGYEHVVNGYRWQIPAGAIQVWLGATVVQIIGVVLVIARSLFPSEQSN